MNIHEVRIALTVDDFDCAVATVQTWWGDRNARVRAPDGMQLTLLTPPEED